MTLDQQRLQQFLDIPYIEQKAIFFAPSAWAENLGLKGADQFCLPNISLNRDEVREYCQDLNRDVLFGYLCVMAWGGQGIGVTRGNAIKAWENKDRIIENINILRINHKLQRECAYNLFVKNKIPGLGSSYWTKLIFFFYFNKDKYIMDQWTAKSINYLWGGPIVPMSGDILNTKKFTGTIYKNFCECIDELALIATNRQNEGRRWTGEQIEQRLFSAGGKNPGDFRKLIREFKFK